MEQNTKPNPLPTRSYESVEILKAAQELISIPERWTKGGSARDNLGRVVYAASPAACCWCAFGAVSRMGCPELDWYLVAAAGLDPDATGIAGFNDDPATTHADILALFDRAIELAAEEPTP